MERNTLPAPLPGGGAKARPTGAGPGRDQRSGAAALPFAAAARQRYLACPRPRCLWLLPGLDVDQMKALQTKLQALGHEVGKIDGILGSGTRVAVQKEQQKLGMPADGWPTAALLGSL